MTKKKGKPRGRPSHAIASDFDSIVSKANWELDKFNAKVANNMGKILEEYYDLAFNAEKENTRLTVLKELIKMQKELAEVVEATEDLEKDTSEPEKETKPADNKVVSLLGSF